MIRLVDRMMVTMLGAAALAAPALLAQTAAPPAPEKTQAVIKGGAEEVVLDVIVRDKHGKAVTDLTAKDFEITDNGEKHAVKSFRLVQGAEAVAAGAGAGAGQRTQLDPLRQIRLVTLIYQGLDLTGRKMARDASLDLLKSDLPQNVYMAVMVIDHQLEAIQKFTNDRELLKAGVLRATGGDNTNFVGDTERVQAELQQILGPNPGGQSLQQQVNTAQDAANGAASGASTNPGSVMSAQVNALTAQMMLQMLQGQQGMAMIDWGRSSIYALLSAVKEQYRLPGRKTIIYFTPGFSVPQGMEQAFKNVISIANRSNVSFYSIDTRGVGAGGNSGASNMLNSAADSSRRQAQSTGYEAVSRDQATVFDTAIESSRANTQITLSELSDSTGGFLIANTNDLRAPLRRLNEDIETYYEISYTPEIQKYDGSFRKVVVKSDRADLKIQSRSGYFALPPSMVGNGKVIAGYEVPLLKAFDSTPLPKAFAYHSDGMHFRGLQNQSVGEIVIDVPLTSFKLQEDKAAGTFNGSFSYLAVIKDAAGEVAKKFGNEIPLKVAAAKMGALAQSHFIYTERVDLPPGRYSLETAVMDQQGETISADKSSLLVPASEGKLGISSVAVVRTMKDKDQNTAPADPWLIGDKVISPTLEPVIMKATTPTLPFYLVVYPNQQQKGVAPELTMEFTKDGQLLGSGPAPLNPPDKEGRIQYVAKVPVEQLPSGHYSVRFIVKQGDETAVETVAFVLE
jgi:VWFA-related protein